MEAIVASALGCWITASSFADLARTEPSWKFWIRAASECVGLAWFCLKLLKCNCLRSCSNLALLYEELVAVFVLLLPVVVLVWLTDLFRSGWMDVAGEIVCVVALLLFIFVAEVRLKTRASEIFRR